MVDRSRGLLLEVVEHAHAPTVVRGARDCGPVTPTAEPSPVVAVVGATAVGKSDLGVALAQQLGGEIVNADSMQLYRGMDVGTAKLTEAEQGGVVHHVLDVWDVHAAERDPAGITSDQALALMCAPEGPELDALGALADDLRRAVVGRRGHLRREPQHQLHQRLLRRVPVLRLRPATDRDADAYTLSLDEIGAGGRGREASDVGATEVCLQGGIDPQMPARPTPTSPGP